MTPEDQSLIIRTNLAENNDMQKMTTFEVGKSLDVRTANNAYNPNMTVGIATQDKITEEPMRIEETIVVEPDTAENLNESQTSGVEFITFRSTNGAATNGGC